MDKTEYAVTLSSVTKQSIATCNFLKHEYDIMKNKQYDNITLEKLLEYNKALASTLKSIASLEKILNTKLHTIEKLSHINYNRKITRYTKK